VGRGQSAIVHHDGPCAKRDARAVRTHLLARRKPFRTTSPRIRAPHWGGSVQYEQRWVRPEAGGSLRKLSDQGATAYLEQPLIDWLQCGHEWGGRRLPARPKRDKCTWECQAYSGQVVLASRALLSTW